MVGTLLIWTLCFVFSFFLFTNVTPVEVTNLPEIISFSLVYVQLTGAVSCSELTHHVRQVNTYYNVPSNRMFVLFLPSLTIFP